MIEGNKVAREGYKLSEVGQIPLNWDLRTVGDLYKFEGGQQPPRKYFSSIEQEGFIRLIQIRDYKTDKYKTYIPKELAKRFCNADDIMIGRYGPPIFQILRGLEGSYNVALIKAIPNELLDKEYAYYFLCDEKLFHLIDRLSQRTSGQTGVDMEALKSYFFPLPPLGEQKKIAEILSTVDEQVENTEQLIEKTKELKKGLMQQLLTKGIGHTELKQTELGEIPVEWEVVDFFYYIKQILDFRGRTPKKLGMDWGNGNIPALSANNVKMGYIDFEAECYLGSQKLYDKWMSKGDLERGDVLFTMEAPLGNVTLVPDDNAYILSQRVVAFKTAEELDNEYFKYYLMSSLFREKLDKNATGTTAKGISQKNLAMLKVIVPSLMEQQKIASILSSVDEQIESYEQEKEKYLELKKGLMQQLLTGKIRVTV